MQHETKTIKRLDETEVRGLVKSDEPEVKVLIVLTEKDSKYSPPRSREFKSTVKNLCFSKMLSNAANLSMGDGNTINMTSMLEHKLKDIKMDRFELEAKALGYCIEYMNHFKTLPDKPDGEHFRFYPPKPLFSSELKYLYNDWTAKWLGNIQVESDKFAKTLNLGTSSNGRPIGFNILPAFILNVAYRIDSHELVHVFASFFAIHIRGVEEEETRRTLLANGVGREELVKSQN